MGEAFENLLDEINRLFDAFDQLDDVLGKLDFATAKDFGYSPDVESDIWADLNRRAFNATAMWGHKLLIWGGCYQKRNMYQSPRNKELVVYNTVTKILKIMRCTGKAPAPSLGLISQESVIDDCLYVIATDHLLRYKVHVLNLNTLSWSELTVAGTPPLPFIHCASWAWRDRIYIFGGLSYGSDYVLKSEQAQVEILPLGDTDCMISNQFVVFSVKSLSWEWLNCTGHEIPSPRVGARIIVDGDNMIFFGGSNGSGRSAMSEAYVLHIPTLKWSQLNAVLEAQNAMCTTPKMAYCTIITSIGRHRALVHEPFTSKEMPGHTWFLTWSLNGNTIANLRWEKKLHRLNLNLDVELNMDENFSSTSQCSPESSRLYVLGVCDSTELICALVMPQSLFEASLSSMRKAGTIDQQSLDRILKLDSSSIRRKI